MTQEQLLFASLIGSKLVKMVPRLEAVENEMSKHVLPSARLLPLQRMPSINAVADEYQAQSWVQDAPAPDTHFFPLSFSIDSGASWFQLPWEPMITIAGKNNIVRRNVAKFNPEYSKLLKGTIKERWSQDDYSITITGFLFGQKMTGSVDEAFPRDDFEKLKQVLTHTKEVMVCCPILELSDIHQIVIEDFTFPFSKGENVQAYEIKAYSDDSYNLLIQKK